MDEIAPEQPGPDAQGPDDTGLADDAGVADRRRGRTWLGGAGTVVLVGLAVTGVQLWANLSYDDAEAAFQRSRAASAPATTTLIATMDDADEATDAAKAVDGVTAPELLSAEDRAALAAAADGLAQERADAGRIGLDPPSGPGEKPLMPWELFLRASDLRDRTTALDDRTAAQSSAARSLSGTISEVDDLGRDILQTARTAVPAIEKSTVDARCAPIVTLRKAAEDLKHAASSFDEGASDSLLELDEAVAAVRASAKSELAAKAGPLYDARRKAEAYARSISGGVLLEFVWTDRLLGQGAGQSGAGTATWDGNDGGTSHITLTNSIARYWPAEWTRALVTHEVGHSISAKCYEKFDWEDQDANEQWATAWAMSWGFSAYDSGANIYGTPSKALQNTAKTCR
ncbi:hypothetical protein L2X99_03925 [Microbacterium sp. KUDC0406]|uniref:hypothetical protein n=1 Tax=Microbacterium sp. KUDC0406 TaxID=2909588 RepID=UPI001F1C24DE|nr:hypothetical protein [Microbacterium sp. KUDC0406]UJP10798.1 hypothetical protein L2X99_03925 [Microbacterium sp. KUDC0406]